VLKADGLQKISNLHEAAINAGGELSEIAPERTLRLSLQI
jgi:hypothetical protein